MLRRIIRQIVLCITSVSQLTGLGLTAREAELREARRIKTSTCNAMPSSDQIQTDIKLEIVITQTDFSADKKTKVQVKITNISKRKLKLSKIRTLKFSLSRRKREVNLVRRGELFGATFPLKRSQTITHGKSIEFTVNLANLFWTDTLSSAYPESRWANLFETVPAGEYYLSLELSLPSNSNPDDSIQNIVSNEILVTLAK